MPESLLVWGGGGHGKVVADLIRALGHRVAGFIDADPRKLGAVVEPGGAAVVVSQDEFMRLAVDGHELPFAGGAVALAVGANRPRLRGLPLLGGRVAPALIHPAATVSPSARVGRGSVVLAGAVLNADAGVGDATIVNTGAIVEHDCVIGDGVHLSPRATLCGGVQVGEGSWICAGATVIPGVRVGRWAVVGAGALVLRDVPDGVTVMGVPAKPVIEVD